MKLQHEIKKSQIILAVCIGTLAAGTSGAFMYYLGRNNSPHEHKDDQKVLPIETATDRVNPNEVWRIKLEGKIEDSQKKVELIEKMMSETLSKVAPENDEISDIRKEITLLKEQQNHLTSESQTSNDAIFSSNKSQPGFQPFKEAEGIQEGIVKEPGIQKIILNLDKEKRQNIKKTTDNTIPAGAFVKATLLGGVDASTSIQASSDPRPVLLRLVDHGTLPRKLKSNLKNCHVLASAYGDLSSERVYMRLEKLSCTIPQTNEISEMTVSGYVAGEDGKAGLRGVVVDRSGPALRNSFMGGFFGGMGKFLTQTQQTYSYPLGNMAPFAQANPLTNDQMLKAGLSSGMGHALDRYADFYIKRAEQMQPVLQVAAGRQVDIVFSQSTPIDETIFNNAIAKQNDQKRREKALKAGDGSSMKEIVIQHESLSH